jgi:hypothetical protein
VRVRVQEGNELEEGISARVIVDETRLSLYAQTTPRNPPEKSHELTSIANAERKCVLAVVEVVELCGDDWIEANCSCPSLGRI